MTYWFPWKHPMARRQGLEVGVFDQTPRKWARRLGPTALPLDLPQNYHSQSIGSALWASLFAFLGAFARKQNKCRLGPMGLAFQALQMHQVPIFRPFEVRLAVSDVLRSITPSVKIRNFIPVTSCPVCRKTGTDICLHRTERRCSYSFHSCRLHSISIEC